MVVRVIEPRRRTRTDIKLEIIKTVFLRGPTALYSRAHGGLAHQIATNPRTFTYAIAELERSGLIACEEVPAGRARVKVVRLTDRGRQMVAPSLELLSRL